MACHPHQHSAKLPHLWLTFATPLLTPSVYRRIPLLTGPRSTYPVGIGTFLTRRWDRDGRGRTWYDLKTNCTVVLVEDD